VKITNFLPWRHRRQQHCWRFWGLLFIGSLLVSLVAVMSLRVVNGLKTRVIEAHLASETAIHQALIARRAQQAPPRTPETGVLRARTQAWQKALVSLASIMPDQAWLTQMRYQQSRLELSGYAATQSALVGLGESLRQLPGFTLGPAGEMLQDAQGRWTFSFTLTSQG
jgi:pilus assembly protein HofN